LGKVFAAKTGEENLPAEKELLAIALTGGEISSKRVTPSRELDFYDLKGAVEAALDAVGFADAEFAAENVKHLRKGQSASVSVGGVKVGYLGRLSDEIAANYKFKQPVYIAELDLQTVLAQLQPTVLYRPLPKYPSVVRDVSLLVKRSLNFAEIRNAVSGQNAEICRSVQFVDVYEGKGIADDERSITVRLEYRSDERTLIDEEVDTVHNKIVKSLENNLGAKQRF
jgi:phenylalanyl-tRNA synthetase beta chain